MAAGHLITLITCFLLSCYVSSVGSPYCWLSRESSNVQWPNMLASWGLPTSLICNVEYMKASSLTCELTAVGRQLIAAESWWRLPFALSLERHWVLNLKRNFSSKVKESEMERDKGNWPFWSWSRPKRTVFVKILPTFHSHKELIPVQVRRYVYHDVVRLNDISKLVDCSGVQVRASLRFIWESIAQLINFWLKHCPVSQLLIVPSLGFWICEERHMPLHALVCTILSATCDIDL